MECPLYDNLRVRVLQQLQKHRFDFSCVANLMCMYVRMLCVSDRQHVRVVGRFLADCLAVRDIFLNVSSSVWCKPARLHDLQMCVQSAPTSSQQSLQFLHRLSACVCDVSSCGTVYDHLQEIWLAHLRNT
eukprot:GDKI01002360.1.p1 GENE.GDKI01002360.1~~GDKI01002360.1.p1  ORF type:complete len:130 (+),score=16.62 GDKI01002360.1:43-432(+)